ncbi:MarR family transcriptional regulator [Acinetobacter sp. S40]|uniref:MarR family winged helix-turn-helix transcriptional regulator n=1 Tax=unclassified Acinetobacter TaxID=196816 RepID=UPI00190AA22E|nr:MULTISPECIES: MarR family transcriptional regulator [unclassified Acinetobacter]MBJ9985289.1 MarR family transcriptional regulator [Acinetobacter sp. S40]MBK0063851.1 MarR family transcriptional regulator [Acinetobacter sp. S55]MBK0067081.1 MarR family transcriptional regulator [Acinetobacter sp. S54]
MNNTQEKMYDPALYSIHNRLFFRLFQVGNSLDRQCFNQLGISPVHWSVLGALSRPHAKTGMSFSDLTEYLGVSRQNLTLILKRLERDGFVERLIDHQDRRAKNVALTALGHKNWENLQEQIFSFYHQAMDGIAFDDAVTLIHLLNKVNEGLNRIKIEDVNTKSLNNAFE